MYSDNKLEQRILATFIEDISTFDLSQHALSLLHTIDIKDFANTNYQKIFELYIKLHNQNSPLNEVFVTENLDKKYHDNFIEIYATIPDARIEDNIKLLKIRRAKRELKLSVIPILNDNDEDVDTNKIHEKLEQLNKIKHKTQNKNFDNSFIKFLDSYDMNPNIMKNLEFEYIYDNFIAKAELTMIAAKPGSGKSLTTVAIANEALINKQIDDVLYFDLDNSITTLKQRNIDILKQNHEQNFRYFHPTFVKKEIIWQIIRELQNRNLKDKLLIFDSAKNFMQNGDRDKNKDVSKLMDVFKGLRDKGATVIFLHHTNKPSRDLEELVYAGSSAWEEDTTNAYILNKNENKKAFIFKHFKSRVGDLDNFAFQYNDNHTLTKLDYLSSAMTEEDEEIRDEIISYLKENSDNVIARGHTKILIAINKNGFARHKINAILKKLIDINWLTHRQVSNNRLVYSFFNQQIIVNKSNMLNKPINTKSFVENQSEQVEYKEVV